MMALSFFGVLDMLCLLYTSSVKVSETVDNIYSDQALIEELIDEFKAYITNQQWM